MTATRRTIWTLPRAFRLAMCLAGGALVVGIAPPAAQAQINPIAPPPPQVPTAVSRQLTVFGLLATPDSSMLDPRLRPIEQQLRTLFPGQGFRLLGVETRRIGVNETHLCVLEGGFQAQTLLVNPLDANGKVQLRFQLDRDGQIEFATLVNTPLNQLFFFDKQLRDGTRLVVGIGARP